MRTDTRWYRVSTSVHREGRPDAAAVVHRPGAIDAASIVEGQTVKKRVLFAGLSEGMMTLTWLSMANAVLPFKSNPTRSHRLPQPHQHHCGRLSRRVNGQPREVRATRKF
ncbi:MAG: hypothetical protein ACYTAO_09005 [Planctomycetota bacterium]